MRDYFQLHDYDPKIKFHSLTPIHYIELQCRESRHVYPFYLTLTVKLLKVKNGTAQDL